MTTLLHLVVALALAAVLSALLGLALSWRRSGDAALERPLLLPIFGVVVALVAWLGGAWLSAHDPAWVPRWLSALLAGSLAALILVALVAGEQRAREPREPIVGGGAAALGGAQAAPGLTALLWGLLVGVVALAALMWLLQVPA